MKKTYLLLFFSLLIYNNNVFSALGDDHWWSIAKDISKDGTPDNLAELDMAIQALRNIKSAGWAIKAVDEIRKTWKGKKIKFLDHSKLTDPAKFEQAAEVEITIANAKPKAGDLIIKDLKRYQNMTDNEVKVETQYVASKYKDNLLKDSGVKCTIS